jgi:hypothetical protein
VHSDDEKTLSDFFNQQATARGIKLETTPPYQPDQNGYAERYGVLILKMARQMTIDANLPSYLWPEAAKTAVYIQNRIPHRLINWQSPHEALAAYLGDNALYWLQAKPDLSNIRIFGCKAYVRINKLPRLAKLALRAAIGYLVGYEAHNIWRIWIPSNRRVIRARDVQFNEDEFYDSSLPNQRIRVYEEDLSQSIDTLDEEETLKILDDIDIPIASQQTMQHDLGGGSPSTTANLDPAAPSQPSETSHSPRFQLTSDQNDTVLSDHDEILGD